MKGGIHGMLQIRLMTSGDIVHGMRLKQQAGWNQTEADWQRFLKLQPDGCFIGEFQGRPVATGTTCVLDREGWIGMILVDESMRRRGFGTRMMRHCLEHLARLGVEAARLDATPLGRPLYEKLGFVPEYELVRMEGAACKQPPHPYIEPVNAKRLNEVLSLDREIRWRDRYRLLKCLYEENPAAMHVFVADGRVRGYVTWRQGMHATQIGPAVALDAEAGRALCDAALTHCPPKRVFVDIPIDNKACIDWAASCGLIVQRPLIRMCRGKRRNDQPALQWASSGPEKG